MEPLKQILKKSEEFSLHVPTSVCRQKCLISPLAEFLSRTLWRNWCSPPIHKNMLDAKRPANAETGNGSPGGTSGSFPELLYRLKHNFFSGIFIGSRHKKEECETLYLLRCNYFHPISLSFCPPSILICICLKSFLSPSLLYCLMLVLCIV